MITASGEKFEQAQNLTDPAERRARDEALQAVFADPTSRHHEAIAEAELDIDYRNSPIVLGDSHAALTPGQRLPDTLEVRLKGGEICLLHELANCTGHTALLIGGMSADPQTLINIKNSIQARNASVVDAAHVLMVRSENYDSCHRLSTDSASQLGIDNVTLLVIRPDGHVGMRRSRTSGNS